MTTFFRFAAAWVAAAAVSAILISLISTQIVLHELSAVGATITGADRLSMSLADLAILQTLLPLMLACFLVAFLVSGLCHKLLGGSRSTWFLIAGASAIVCTLLLMSWVLNLIPIAGARGISGTVLIAIAGGLGGLLFARLSQRTSKTV